MCSWIAPPHRDSRAIRNPSSEGLFLWGEAMAHDLAPADAGDVALKPAEVSRPLYQSRLVTLDGKMGDDGYLPENAAWFDLLTKPDDETGRTRSDGRLGRIGRDPMCRVMRCASIETCAANASIARRTAPRSDVVPSSTAPCGPTAWAATRIIRSAGPTPSAPPRRPRQHVIRFHQERSLRTPNSYFATTTWHGASSTRRSLVLPIIPL